jgi:hypothetical protein
VETQAQALPQSGARRTAITALLVDLLVTALWQPAAVSTAIWQMRPWTLIIPLAYAAVPLAVALWALRGSPRVATWLALVWAVALAFAAGAWVLFNYPWV